MTKYIPHRLSAMLASTSVAFAWAWLATCSYPVAAAQPALTKQGKKDIEAVKKFLFEKHPGARWQRGPTRAETADINKAFPGSRFYFVFSPQYPIGRVGFLTVMVRIDKAGNVTEITAPQDYGAGLKRIRNASDAKIAGAAIMSLTFGPFGPVPVSAAQVATKARGKGWLLTAAVNRSVFRVRIEAGGTVTEAAHHYTGPLPICIGGLFDPANVPGGIEGLGHRIGGALRVASVEPDSIAARAGLEQGDVIVSFDHRPLPTHDTIQQMRQIVYPLKQQGQTQRAIGVLRDGRLIELTLRW